MGDMHTVSPFEKQVYKKSTLAITIIIASLSAIIIGLIGWLWILANSVKVL
jgi:hypothetical protein